MLDLLNLIHEIAETSFDAGGAAQRLEDAQAEMDDLNEEGADLTRRLHAMLCPDCIVVN